MARSKAKAKAALANLEQKTTRTDSFIKSLQSGAVSLSKENSEIVFAIATGISGTILSFFIAAPAAAAGGVWSTTLAAAGLAFGILFFRGPGEWRQARLRREQQLQREEATRNADVTLDEIARLKKMKAPQHVLDSVYQRYLAQLPYMTPEPIFAGQRSQPLPQPIYIQLPAPTTPVPVSPQ